MKVIKASYIDDGAIIRGVLVKRFAWKPVFYASDVTCGWDSQVITKAEEPNLIIWPVGAHESKVLVLGGTGSGKSRHPDVDAYKAHKAYEEAIKATIDSGLAEKILKANPQKEQKHEHSS